MKFFLRTLALLLCAVLVFSSAVSAADIIAEDEAADTAVLTADETADEPGDSEEPGEPEETEKPAPQLVLTDSQISVTVNAKFQIKAETANFENANIEWSSANPGIATVNNKGVVTGKAVGKTKIKVTATDGQTTLSATCAVNVANRKAIPHFLLSISYR